ncbi:MAG: K(+)/H(+) antiporter NhaP2 [Elusimicrobia bacterium ADurb.Bin231]|nr:MAG: K(+)/H(+) antiporter NhaP2 [Elusimicrobia bacterium ADurb.Bin231]
MIIETIILWIGVLILLSIIASKISEHFMLPALLLFLAIGMLAGSEGIGGVYFDDPGLAKSIGVISLILIIFSGGLSTEWKAVRPMFVQGLLLATLGVMLTAVVVGVFAVYILKFTLLEGLLLGSIVSSTDAAAVFSVLRSRKISLKGYLKPLLEFESGSNDPMAVFLTVGCLSILTNPQDSLISLFPLFILNMGMGFMLGYIMSRVSIYIINTIKLEYEGLYLVLTIGLILFTYSLTTLLKGNGFLAVYFLGLLLNKDDFVQKRSISRFYDGIGWLMQIVMFLTLGLLVFPSQIIPIMPQGLLLAIILMFVARPVAVFLCLKPFKFTLPEKAMISWVGLRGAVPIVLATFPLLEGIPQANTIFNIVFFVTLTSVLIQGSSIHIVSKLFGVDTPIDVQKKYPIRFEQTEGIDLSLADMFVPYNSDFVGKTLSAINMPPKALIVLISRDENFIVPNGSTVLEGGDVLLVLANETDRNVIQSRLSLVPDKDK